MIAISGHTIDDDQERLEKSGVLETLPKPLSSERLIQAVTRALSRA